MSCLSMTGQRFCSILATCYSFVTQVCIRYWTRWRKVVTETQTNVITLFLGIYKNLKKHFSTCDISNALMH